MGRASEIEAFSPKRGREFFYNQERFKAAAERGWSSHVQLEAMDAEGN